MKPEAVWQRHLPPPHPHFPRLFSHIRKLPYRALRFQARRSLPEGRLERSLNTVLQVSEGMAL